MDQSFLVSVFTAKFLHFVLSVVVLIINTLKKYMEDGKLDANTFMLGTSIVYFVYNLSGLDDVFVTRILIWMIIASALYSLVQVGNRIMYTQRYIHVAVVCFNTILILITLFMIFASGATGVTK